MVPGLGGLFSLRCRSGRSPFCASSGCYHLEAHSWTQEKVIASERGKRRAKQDPQYPTRGHCGQACSVKPTSQACNDDVERYSFRLRFDFFHYLIRARGVRLGGLSTDKNEVKTTCELCPGCGRSPFAVFRQIFMNDEQK